MKVKYAIVGIMIIYIEVFILNNINILFYNNISILLLLDLFLAIIWANADVSVENYFNYYSALFFFLFLIESYFMGNMGFINGIIFVFVFVYVKVLNLEEEINIIESLKITCFFLIYFLLIFLMKRNYNFSINISGYYSFLVNVFFNMFLTISFYKFFKKRFKLLYN